MKTKSWDRLQMGNTCHGGGLLAKQAALSKTSEVFLAMTERTSEV